MFGKYIVPEEDELFEKVQLVAEKLPELFGK
jgi:hypothetical protein